MMMKDVVVAGGLALVLLTSCDQGGGKAALEELEERLEALQSKTADLNNLATKLRRDLGQLSETREKLEALVDAARAEATLMRTDSESTTQAFASYRTKYREAIRKRAPGMDLGELNLGGIVMHGAQVRSLDAWEVAVGHTNGVTRFELAKLPEDFKLLFGYDPAAGPKPSSDVVTNPLGASSVMTAPTSSGSGNAASAASASTGPAVPAYRPVAAPPPSSAGSSKSSGKEPLNAITTFEGVGMGGMGGGGGTKIKGAGSSVPSGYKPIGSSFNGSNMERNTKK